MAVRNNHAALAFANTRIAIEHMLDAQRRISSGGTTTHNDAQRLVAWQAAACAKQKLVAAEDSYLQLLVRASSSELSDCSRHHIIDKDTPRHGVRFDGGVSEPALRRVLIAYLVRSGDYCQGMNTVAAFLLTVLEEADAFWMLAYLIEDVLPEHFYSRDLLGLRAELRVVRACMASYLPSVSIHIAAQTLSSAFDDVLLMRCLAVLFVNELPRPLVLQVWDALILTRGALALTHGCLALLRTIGPELCSVTKAK